ncbi:MAG: hypothetical protein PHP37_04360 [Patescibacteria group bacterium]|jgi:TRAP-type C4-dicarboxylate transport system permease small subunit|nr:hypothetical protein [Patescibacteria group bacterium]
MNKLALQIDGTDLPKVPLKIFGSRLTNWSSVSQAIINTLLLIIILAAFIGLIYAGYQYITSEGNPEKAQTAKATILGSIIALILAASAYAIVTFIYGKIT